MTLGGLAAAVALVAVLFVLQRPAPAAGPLVPPAAPTPTDLADGTALGKATAPVTLEVYSDFQCPVCGAFAREVFPRLVTNYVEPGRLRIVEHEVDILDRGGSTESADAAAAAACAADQDRYWPYHDYLFANQHGENVGAFGRATLLAIARAVGLDETTFTACLDGGTHQAAVRSLTLQAQITATPTFVLAGQRYQGLLPYDQLAALIDRAAASASPATSASPGASPGGG